MNGWITRSYIILALVLLVLAFPIGAEPKSEEDWTKYSGHNISFEYPAEWNTNRKSYWRDYRRG